MPSFTYTSTDEWNPKRVTDLRGALGFTQTDLAGAVGVTRDAVAQWEMARRKPTAARKHALETLERLGKLGWNGQSSHALVLLKRSKPDDVSCETINAEIVNREVIASEIIREGGAKDGRTAPRAGELTRLNRELLDLRALAREKGCLSVNIESLVKHG